MQDDGFSLTDLTGLIRRRAATVGSVFFGIVMITFIIAYSLQSLYRSSGTIMIEQREVSDKFLPGTYQEANRGQRIERIYDEVMTTTNLSDIVEKHNLYSEQRGDGSPRSVVSELRENLEMDFRLSDDDPRNRTEGQIVGLVLSYYHADPETARDVARDIVGLFQEGNKKRRQVAYQETAAALERETESLREQVAALEAQLADFKSENPGALPEDRLYNRQIIERKDRDLDSLDREIRSLQERKTLLQSQLAQTDLWITTIGPTGDPLPTSNDQLRNLQAEYLQMLGNYSPTHPDVVRLKRQIEALNLDSFNPAFRQGIEAELAAKRSQLLEARRKYSDDYPDIKNMERAVAALEQQIADMPMESQALPPPNNPTYLNLQLQLDAVNSELTALRKDASDLEAETRELDRRMQFAPEVERRYLALTRDHGLASQQYEDIKSRLMSVQRAGTLEEEELSERYVLTRYPNLPFKHAYPNRPLIIVLGIFLGLSIAISVGIAKEALDGTIRNTRDIRTILDMPPIAAIPRIHSQHDMRAIRTSRSMYVITLGAITTAVAIYVYLQATNSI